MFKMETQYCEKHVAWNNLIVECDMPTLWLRCVRDDIVAGFGREIIEVDFCVGKFIMLSVNKEHGDMKTIQKEVGRTLVAVKIYLRQEEQAAQSDSSPLAA